MRTTIVALIAGIAIGVCGPSFAADADQDFTDMQALRKASNVDKQTLVESTLKLTPAEAKKFWPIYTAYQRSLDASSRRRNVVLEQLLAGDRPVSDLYAKDLAAETLAADEAEIKARRTLHNRLMRALPAKKAARYMQLEAKLRALVYYDIAATFPLIR
jgi:outer membrane PBP1 activator LpoA protein